jgi:cytochrome c oxidase subunit IV
MPEFKKTGQTYLLDPNVVRSSKKTNLTRRFLVYQHGLFACVFRHNDRDRLADQYHFTIAISHFL